MRVSLGVLTCLCATGCLSSPEAAEPADPYIAAAIQAGSWLQAQSVDAGILPDRLGEPSTSSSLGGGASGRALFFAELFAATSDSTFRTSALLESDAALASDSTGSSLYRGMSGVAFSLTEVGRILADPGLEAEGRRLFLAVTAAAPSRGGAGWGEAYDVLSGWAGVGLALLYAHGHFTDEVFRDTAVELGDSLLMAAEPTGNDGLRWFRDSTREFDLPNFSHGTAGVGFFLARLASATGLARFDDAAAAAVRYLDAIADTTGGRFLVPYGVPNEGYATPYDVGWAHGPAGTALLHYERWTQTGDPAMEARLHASARTLLASGLPGPSADSAIWRGPFRLDRRFGSAGSADFLLGLGQTSQDQTYLDAALQVVDAIVSAAMTDRTGMYWSLPLYGFQAGEGEAVFTGYFYGVAGLGLTLLKAHYVITERAQSVRFPDDPLGNVRSP